MQFHFLSCKKPLTFLLLALVILSFLLLVTITFWIYSFEPPRINEYKEITFQVYFSSIDEATARKLFIAGHNFTPGVDKDSKAAIVKILFLDASQPSTINVLATITARAKVDSDGDLLYDVGYDVNPGMRIPFYLDSSVFEGLVYRVGYTHHTEKRNVTLRLYQACEVPMIDDVLINKNGDVVGNITSIIRNSSPANISCQEETLLVTELFVDNYDGKYYINEVPLLPGQHLYLFINNTPLLFSIID